MIAMIKHNIQLFAVRMLITPPDFPIKNAGIQSNNIHDGTGYGKDLAYFRLHTYSLIGAQSSAKNCDIYRLPDRYQALLQRLFYFLQRRR